MEPTLLDKWSYIVAIATWIFTIILFWTYTSELFFSIIAGALAAGLAWMSYVLMRWLVLALK